MQVICLSGSMKGGDCVPSTLRQRYRISPVRSVLPPRSRVQLTVGIGTVIPRQSGASCDRFHVELATRISVGVTSGLSQYSRTREFRDSAIQFEPAGIFLTDRGRRFPPKRCQSCCRHQRPSQCSRPAADARPARRPCCPVSARRLRLERRLQL